MAKKQRAALICRVSTPQQIKIGLESQVITLKKRAMDDGYEVPDSLIFQEQVSGFDDKDKIRKSLKDLMDAVEEHKVDVCYTYELTRISRNPFHLIDRVKWFTDRLIPMYIYDVDLWTLDRKTKEEIEETTEYIFGAATYGKVEAEKMKNRTMRARNLVAKEGLYVGHLSDGYCVVQTERGKEIKPDDERKEVIKKIFDLYEQGNTVDRIAEYLNINNIPTASKYRFHSPKFKGYQETYRKKSTDVPINRDDTKWQGSVVCSYLRNKWYIGERMYKDNPLSHDPIITTEQWSIVSTLLEENSQNFRSRRESQKHIYLLSRLIFCGKCGKRMYGHYTGLNNHYFCSSVEEGIKCGLRGVCKENIEAAIAMAIKTKGWFELMGNKDGVVEKFFKLDPKEEKRIKKEIDNNKQLISICDKQIEENKTNYEEAIRQSVLYKDNKSRVEALEKVITGLEEEKSSLENKKIRLIQKNLINAKKINIQSNVKNILDRMLYEENLHTLKDLFHAVIEKVLVYNLTASINMIRVYFIDSQVCDFIYAYRLLKENIIFIRDTPFIRDLFHYDEKRNAIICKKAPCVICKGKIILYNDYRNKSSNEIKQTYGIEGVDYVVIHDPIIPAKDFVKMRKPLGLLVTPFKRLEEPTEEAKEQDAKYKEWRKKYNTGLPSCVPYVVRNEDYEEISIRRKHLYNRKNKIKKHKKLSEAEKTKRMAEIDEELALLSAKVKYLNRDEAVKEYKRKQQEELERIASEPLD